MDGRYGKRNTESPTINQSKEFITYDFIVACTGKNQYPSQHVGKPRMKIFGKIIS